MCEYRGRHLLSLVLSRPFDVLIALACILTGLRILIDGNATPSSIGDMPAAITTVYRILLLSAGALYLAGLLRRKPSAMERAGLWLAATAFIAYGLAAVIAGITAQATLAIILVFCVGAACALRAVGVARESRARLQALKEAPRRQWDE